MPVQEYNSLQLVTPQVISRAVLYDGQARLWFRKLFTSRQLLKELDCSPGGFSTDIRRYQIFSLFSLVLMLAAAISGIAALVLPKALVIPLVVSGSLAAVGFMITSACERQLLAGLTARLVEVDRPTFPPGMTLYQMGEVYSEKYHVPSLVDTIWWWDHWLRHSFLAIYFVTFGVYFLPFWKMVLWTAAGCYLVLGAVKLLVMHGKGR